MYKYNDLTGDKYGRLTVLSQAGRTNDRHILWLCKCDCGKGEVYVSSKDLKSGHTTSCGCFRKEQTSKAKIKHGASGDHKNIERLYKVWVSMRKRCNNSKDHSFKHYGGLGVKVCDEWNDYQNFRDWAYSNGYEEDAPYGKCTIDRINPYGDYAPDNCRWVDMKIQNQNKRSKMGAKMKGEENGE